MKKMKGVYRPDAAVPQCFSTPSTAAAIALPFSAALSIRAIASYRHLAMSSSAMTSPFSTTGKCLNLPGAKGNFSGDITRTAGKVRKKKCQSIHTPCTIFCNASTASVSASTNTGFLVMTFETGVSSIFNSRAITLVVMSWPALSKDRAR